jgi:hypothetical protein
MTVDLSGKDDKGVSVMLLVEKQTPLADWGLSMSTGESFSMSSVTNLFPTEFSLDHGYSPVPVRASSASGGPFVFSTHSLGTQFVVRGRIDVDDPSKVPQEIGNGRVYSDPTIRPFKTCVNSAAIGDQAQAVSKLDVNSLRAEGFDGEGVAIAIMDSGINLESLSNKPGINPKIDSEYSWIPDKFTLGPGEYKVGHGTMCAFDALLAAPNATLLDYPLLIARGFAVHEAQPTVSDALKAYEFLQKKWVENIAQGDNAKYRALVVNNSWGIFNSEMDVPKGHPGRYIDNPNHVFHDSVAALERSGIDILFAAGNCGAGCPDPKCWNHTNQSIMGANAYTEVLTIAACDINDKRLDYSSQGPSIDGMPPAKPDLTMYSHFLASEVAGTGAPDGGTSAACAVASGCVAALRTKISRTQMPPAALFKRLKDTARQVVPGGRNDDYGYGVMDPTAAAKGLV